MSKLVFLPLLLMAVALGTSANSAYADDLPGGSGWALCTVERLDEMVHNNERFLRIHLVHVPDGRRFSLRINNQKDRPSGTDPEAPYPQHINVLRTISEGSFVEIERGGKGGSVHLKRIRIYNLQPGEELPNNFVFVRHEPAVVDFVTDQVTKPAVIHVRKLGQTAEVMIPMVRSEQGVHQPDPAIMRTVMSLSENNVVTMAVRQVPGGVMIQQIQRFHPVRHGDLAEKTTVGFNPARTALRITADDGESFTVLLPGRMVRDEWMPDRRLSQAVERLNVGDRVTF